MNNKSRPRARPRHLFSIALGLAATIALGGSASALTLGAVAAPHLGGCSSCDVFQRNTVIGQPVYRVPAGNWTITSWSAQGGGTAAGQARLRIYRATATPNQFRIVRQSSLQSIPANGHPSFTVSLAVQGGDLLGIGTISNVPSAFSSVTPGPKVSTTSCDPTGVGQLVGSGTTCSLGMLWNEFVNVKVTLIRR